MERKNGHVTWRLKITLSPSRKRERWNCNNYCVLCETTSEMGPFRFLMWFPFIYFFIKHVNGKDWRIIEWSIILKWYQWTIAFCMTMSARAYTLYTVAGNEIVDTKHEAWNLFGFFISFAWQFHVSNCIATQPNTIVDITGKLRQSNDRYVFCHSLNNASTRKVQLVACYIRTFMLTASFHCCCCSCLLITWWFLILSLPYHKPVSFVVTCTYRIFICLYILTLFFFPFRFSYLTWM